MHLIKVIKSKMNILKAINSWFCAFWVKADNSCLQLSLIMLRAKRKFCDIYCFIKHFIFLRFYLFIKIKLLLNL